MCGRFTVSHTQSDLEARFGFKTSAFEWTPRYNIAPTDPVPVVLSNGERRADLYKWGLIPWWSKDRKSAARMINARAETVSQKSTFEESLRTKRCLVLADGFYEWQKAGKERLPTWFGLKSREPFAFAGLWDRWKSPDGEYVRSCTIVTTVANAVTEPVHDRMPVMLTPDAEEDWLDASVREPGGLLELLVPYPADLMVAFRVSTLVNSVRNDSPDCIVPLPQLL